MLKLRQGVVWIVKLPDGKEVTLWAGTGGSKSGVYCRWEHEDHIKQGGVIYSGKETTEHELFVGDWQLSYVNDLLSSPRLKLTILVKKREKDPTDE